MENMTKEPHGFCITPDSKCTMNYCDDNGCVDRKRRWTASGSVAAPKEEENFYSRVTEVRGWLLHQKMEIDDRHVVRLADALHAVSQFKPLESENTALREALKELLPIAENAAYFAGFLPQFTESELEQYENESKPIIERARKLLNP